MAKKPVSEQVVVVVGGSSGVGRSVARLAGERGAKVVVAARGAEGLEAAVADVERAGGEALAVTADVTSEVECDIIVSRSLERFGRIDTFVACAFVSVFAEVAQTEIDELRRVLDVNFVGRVRCLRAALPALRESRGTFVDVNSALAYRSIPLQGAYCASKAATRALLESARVELEHDDAGVDISVLLPGAINTPHFDRVRQKLGVQPQPVPPIYQPEVVANAVLHCAEHPVRELPVTWGAQKVLWAQKWGPRVGDLYLRRTAWQAQTTGESKSTNELDNLFEPLPGDPGAHGRFDDRSRTSSAWTTLRLNGGKPALFGLLGAGVALATMGLRSGRSAR